MLLQLLTYLPMFISLFFGLILFISRGEGKEAKHILGGFMTATFLLYLSETAFFYFQESSFLYFDALYNLCTLSVYPFFFFYIQALTLGKSYKNLNYSFLLPAILLSLITAIIYLMMDSGERNTYIHSFLLNKKQIPLTSKLIKAQIYTYILARIAFVVLFVLTLFKGQVLVRKYNHSVRNTYANVSNKSLFWTLRLLIAFIISSSIVVFINIIGRTTDLDFSGSAEFIGITQSLVFSFLLFTIGHLGFQQKFDVSNLEVATKEECSQKTDTTVQYKLQPELLEKLETTFKEDKIYRQKELKVTELASMLNSNRTYISNLINQEFDCSFSDFVNRYRIQEAKEVIQDHPNEPFDHIANQVGYGSISTFFRSFKQMEGVTPNTFRKQMAK